MSVHLATRAFPARIADLGFALSLPHDWISHDLPQEALNFDDPTQLIALAVVTAPHAAIVLAIAARPAYDDGTVSDWGRYLLDNDSASVRAMGEGRLGALPALIAEATKDSEVGTLVLRAAFAEDGARLVNVTLTAPELLADAVYPVWQAALESFALSTPRGATVRVYPPVTVPVQVSQAEAESAPVPAVDEKPDEPPKAETRRMRKQRRKQLTKSDGPPAWWAQAQALEADGRIEEAVALVGRECQFQGALITQAELWQRTMSRCLAAGDREGARQAWSKSRDFAYGYAASATSGGEGAALSLERDAFLAQLGPEPE
ncbi:MAG TPA: hypothetical protein VL280_04800 [Burkholderiales bacterium]|jgi:hypothetical protein|nr:hypothetical protein [Burkholderiales bacterium]